MEFEVLFKKNDPDVDQVLEDDREADNSKNRHGRRDVEKTGDKRGGSVEGHGDENAPDDTHRPNRVQIRPDIDLFLDEGLPESRLGNGIQDG